MEAVTSAIQKNYCNFDGRASRSEYWWFILFNIIVSVVIAIVFCWNTDVMNVASSIVNLALLLPSVGLAVRRLHDIGKSGWWLLLIFIPVVGGIVLLVWFCQNSQMFDNQYGPVPNLQY